MLPRFLAACIPHSWSFRNQRMLELGQRAHDVKNQFSACGREPALVIAD
jgi:hypothetical protein